MSEEGLSNSPDTSRWQPSLNRTPGIPASIKKWIVLLSAAAMGVLGGCGKACDVLLQDPPNTGDCDDPRNRFEQDCVCQDLEDGAEDSRDRAWARCDEWRERRREKSPWEYPCMPTANGDALDPGMCLSSPLFDKSDEEILSLGITIYRYDPDKQKIIVIKPPKSK